jgi:hypothetical protein
MNPLLVVAFQHQQDQLDTLRHQNQGLITTLFETRLEASCVLRDLHALEEDRAKDLVVLLTSQVRSKLLYYPRPVRGGGSAKVVHVTSHLSAWQWDCLSAHTPLQTTRIHRFTVSVPNNPIQKALLEVQRPGPHKKGRRFVKSLSVSYNPSTQTLRIRVEGESVGFVDGREVVVLERALSRRVFGSVSSLAASTVTGIAPLSLL